MTEGRRLHARIHGVVQGVGFRYSTLQRARRLGLSGYVRNDRDGSVEVVAEGPEEDLKRLLKWLEKGPTGAHVRRLDKNMSEPRGDFDGFTVAH